MAEIHNANPTVTHNQMKMIGSDKGNIILEMTPETYIKLLTNNLIELEQQLIFRVSTWHAQSLVKEASSLKENVNKSCTCTCNRQTGEQWSICAKHGMK